MFSFEDILDPKGDGDVDNPLAASMEVMLKSNLCFPAGNPCRLAINDIEILYFDPNSIIHKVVEIDTTINEAEKSNSDLVEGIYEGGLKIWECTLDIANYLCKQDRTLVSEKQVLDLGCGSGILGVLAYKLNATEVHFQDFNYGVLRHFTMPNISVNNEQLLGKSKFWCGDWKNFCLVNSKKYDVILTSETIYNPKNQEKMLKTLKALINPDGIIILGAKSYYFGVGGSLRQFLDLIEKDNSFSYETVWNSVTGIRREIILMRHK